MGLIRCLTFCSIVTSAMAVPMLAAQSTASPAAATPVAEGASGTAPVTEPATLTSAQQPAASASTAASEQVTAIAADPTTAAEAPAAIPVGSEAESASAKTKSGKQKQEYTGPTEIVILEPTPMLDEEGKQRLDPDGKPMWNPPVKQQRDKHGHPLFDEKGKPVFQTAKEMGYDKDGHKIHGEKEKPVKAVPVMISRGVYTVDGLPGKAALNYDIADLKYIYLWAPGIGVAVVSNVPFPGAKEEKNAFDDKTLTVTVGDHVLQVASETRLMKEKHPSSAFVLLDRETALPSRFPAVGHGDTRKSPYQWPGSRGQEALKDAAFAPPPPADLMPTQLLKPCPTGQMRMPAPRPLPGQIAPAQPCVSIAQAQAKNSTQPPPAVNASPK